MDSEVAVEFAAGEFGEALAFALGGEDHGDRPAVVAPLFEPLEEAAAQSLAEDEVTGFEGADRLAEAGAGIAARGGGGRVLADDRVGRFRDRRR